jgi:DNA-binding XRE family transcriptional regulator
MDRLLEEFAIERPAALVAGLNDRIVAFEAELAEYDACQQIDQGDCLQTVKFLPNRFASVRIWLGWSQTDLARKTGISPQLIHKYEKETYLRTNLATLIKVAAVLEDGVAQKRAAMARKSAWQRMSSTKATDVVGAGEAFDAADEPYEPYELYKPFEPFELDDLDELDELRQFLSKVESVIESMDEGEVLGDSTGL